jgi:hypothetical protein
MVTDRGTTRQALGIFWQVAELAGFEELDGFTVYAYWPRGLVPPPALDLGRWPKVESRVHRLFGEDWTVWQWDIRVHSWPAAALWRSLVLGTLDQLLDAGAAVAWCAVEGAFADPPALFEPRHMSDGVWAARIKDQGGVFQPSGLDEPFETLTDEQLARLRQAAGLAPVQS